jgi:Flp pilus assembly pilin Flp
VTRSGRRPHPGHANGCGSKEEADMQKLRNRIEASARRENGQTQAEYAVVLAVITIAMFGALSLLSGNIVNAISRVAGYLF